LSIENLALGLIICIAISFFLMIMAETGLLGLVGGLVFISGYVLYGGLFTIDIVIVIFVISVFVLILQFKSNNNGGGM
jgi:hypothetical protein